MKRLHPGEPSISKCVYCGEMATRHFSVGPVGYQGLVHLCDSHMLVFWGNDVRQEAQEISAEEATVWEIHQS